MTRIILTALLLAPLAFLHAANALAKRPNLVIITADDMNHDSAGCYGCPIKDLTPNLDRLASEGMRFHYAYSTVAVCQPVREIMHTGLYPHRNGAMGFFPLKSEVRTLNQQLHDGGYLISMVGKNPHYQPEEKFCVDYPETRISRHPSQLATATRKFLSMAREQGRPFFHHVNCTDPHRPFIGAKGPDDLAGGEAPSRRITPEEVVGVPGFLEDLPEVRRELAQYYTSVRRLDDCVGAVLSALDEADQRDGTIVMFYGGDHGMAFPFAKSNNYEDSSRGALIIRWPGKVKPGTVDRSHLVSTLDFTPTLLEATGTEMIPGMDGRSFLAALRGQTMEGWDRVFTFYNQNSGGKWLLMRAVRTMNRAYIWNAWSDGKMQYFAENMSGLAWKAMLAAASTNPAVKTRTDFYLHRVPEEFYDLTSDRYERHNLIHEPSRQIEVESLRKNLLALLQRTGDPLAGAFAQRDQPEFLAAAKERLAEEYARPRRNQENSTPPPAATGAPAAKPKTARNLISFTLPARITPAEPVTLLIRHQFPDGLGEQAITVTMKDGASNARLDRQVVRAKGKGATKVIFSLPASAPGKSIRFAAFVGEDFKQTQDHIQSDALPVN